MGSALYLYPFARVLWRVGDEGLVVYGALRVVNGEVPYRDFFEIMAPGEFYWVALFLKTFGDTWAATRIALVASAVGTTVVVYWLAHRLGSRYTILPAAFVLATGVPLWPAISHHADSNFWALLSLAALITWLETGRRLGITIAGLFAGITTCVMPQKGVLLVLSFVVVGWILRRNTGRLVSAFAWFLGAYVAVGCVVVVGFVIAGAGRDLVYANLLWPLSRYHDVNTTPYAYGLCELFWPHWTSLLKAFLPTWPAYGLALMYLVPLVLVAALPLVLGVLAITAPRASLNAATLPYWLAGGALWISEMHRTDMPHLLFGSPLFVLLCLRLWERWTGVGPRLAFGLVIIGTLVFAIFNVAIAGLARHPVETRRGTVYTFKGDEALTFLQNARVGEDVFVYPYYPMYYFLTATRNAVRFSILVYHYNSREQLEEVVRDVERKQVRYVLWDTVTAAENLTTWLPGYRHPPADQLIVEPYLQSHYEMVGFASGFRLMRRRGIPDD